MYYDNLQKEYLEKIELLKKGLATEEEVEELEQRLFEAEYLDGIF